MMKTWKDYEGILTEEALYLYEWSDHKQFD